MCTVQPRLPPPASGRAGAWLVELAGVQEPALAQVAVATALGLRQAPGTALMDSLTGVLARQQLLLVIDNCEHVLTAVAELCGALRLAVAAASPRPERTGELAGEPGAPARDLRRGQPRPCHGP